VLLPDEFVQSARTHPGREWLRGFTGAPETVGLGRGVRGGAAELLWHALKLMAPSHCYRATTTARRVRWWVRGTRCEVGGRSAMQCDSTSCPEPSTSDLQPYSSRSCSFHPVMQVSVSERRRR